MYNASFRTCGLEVSIAHFQIFPCGAFATMKTLTYLAGVLAIGLSCE
jgi:hypothetical protein